VKWNSDMTFTISRRFDTANGERRRCLRESRRVGIRCQVSPRAAHTSSGVKTLIVRSASVCMALSIREDFESIPPSQVTKNDAGL
jgi:hypothetical protein